MFERPKTGERAVLVHVHFPDGEGEEVLEEFGELVSSAGAMPVAWLGGSRDVPDSRYFVGKGKAEELKQSVTDTGAEIVIFDHALSPAQERNLERLTGCRVIDRIGLILDIFAQRAQSFEGKLQVELAQLKHLSTRLVRGWTHLERQKGGIGLRGPGEKQLEMDRRLITERIRRIRRELDKVERRRELSRRSRRRASVPVVSLVGYTNAGKSTLFNRLTGAGVLTAGQLFATLDPTLRRLSLGGSNPIILADTVGFIRDLPHELVAAFRATLEETRNASLLLHVVDASCPERMSKIDQVNEVLREIGAHEIPQIQVYNKVDRVEGGAGPRREPGEVPRLWLSAKTGVGVDLLCDAVSGYFGESTIHRRVCLPPECGRLRARFFELAKVVEEHEGGDGEWIMEVEIRPATLESLYRNEGLDRARVAA